MGVPFAVQPAALLHQGARRARLRAVAAALADGGIPVRPERRADGGAHAALCPFAAHGCLPRCYTRPRSAGRRCTGWGRSAKTGWSPAPACAFAQRGEGGVRNAHLARHGLQLAGAVLHAAEAVVRRIQAVVGDQQVNGHAAILQHALGGRLHLHAVDHARGARGHGGVLPSTSTTHTRHDPMALRSAR